MKRFLRHLPLLITVLLLLPGLRAQNTPSPFTLPNEPLIILLLPDGYDKAKLSIGISKALLSEQWENLGWESNITTATTTQSKVTVKVFAVANPSEVKLYATYSSGKNIAEDKCKKIALRQLGLLEKAIVEGFNLNLHKGKADEITDRAAAD